MSDLEQLIKLVTAQHRWGLHPAKVAVALLLPVMMLWLADWRIRRLSRVAEGLERPVGTDERSSPVLGG